MSDYNFCGGTVYTADRTTYWEPDPEAANPVPAQRLVVSRPPCGPGVRLAPGAPFEFYRTYLLLHTHSWSADQERYELGIRRLYRALSPWVTENPIQAHLPTTDSASFRLLADQCAEVGFESLTYSFDTDINMENESPAYLAQIKADVDYAHAKGVQVGAYSLFASRHISDDVDVLSPVTGKADHRLL